MKPSQSGSIKFQKHWIQDNFFARFDGDEINTFSVRPPGPSWRPNVAPGAKWVKPLYEILCNVIFNDNSMNIVLIFAFLYCLNKKKHGVFLIWNNFSTGRIQPCVILSIVHPHLGTAGSLPLQTRPDQAAVPPVWLCRKKDLHPLWCDRLRPAETQRAQQRQQGQSVSFDEPRAKSFINNVIMMTRYSRFN